MGGTAYNTKLIAELLRENHFKVRSLPIVGGFWEKPWFLMNMVMRDNFYVTYATALLAFARYASRRKRIICHIVGSDSLSLEGFTDELRRAMKIHSVKLLYASKNLRDELAMEGEVTPIPIKEWLFKPEGERLWEEKRDTLFYCPSPYIYSAWEIDEYIRNHPDDQITVLGMPPDSSFLPDYPNVMTLSTFPPEEMPKLYRSHRRLIRLTRHDGMPKMIYEAFLCGCEVWWNGTRVTSVPDAMRWGEGGRRIAEIARKHFE